MTTIRAYTLSVFEAAKLLGYHPQTIRDKAAMGQIPGIKRGRKWIFSEAELMDFLKAATHQHVQGILTNEFDRKLISGS